MTPPASLEILVQESEADRLLEELAGLNREFQAEVLKTKRARIWFEVGGAALFGIGIIVGIAGVLGATCP